MTSAESFCYVALIKAPQRTSEQLNLLFGTRRSEIQCVLNELHGLAESELRRRGVIAREEERKGDREVNGNRTDLPFHRLSPGLQRWFSHCL